MSGPEHRGPDDADTRGDTAATVAEGPKRKARGSRLSQGDTIGRYVIVGQIGRGGMGLVYKAYDPELDRRIALKLLRVKPDQQAESARQRLLREAQALAQLSHPNVIAVHDVGTTGDDVFIAMELVDGQTLRGWLRKERPTQRQIVAVFVAAGEGLAAAHKAELVHRDFKPDNLLIGHDGRARVIDFGLARTAGIDVRGFDDLSASEQSAMSPTIESEETGSGTGRRRLRTPLTQAGSVVGTPSYMAPEQHRGEAVDARSDQFSFCVALYRALYGERPFSGESAEELAENIKGGRIDPTPRGSKVPTWLRHIVSRGLRVDPDARYPSMSDLLDDLRKDPRRTRRRVALGVGVVALAGLSVFALTGRDKRDQVCKGGPDRVVGVWDDTVRGRMQKAFDNSGRAHAAATFGRVDSALTRYAGDWVQGYTTACEATRVYGDQSEELLDLKVGCLGRRLSKLRALTTTLSDAPPPEMVDRAVVAVGALPSLASCDDERALTSAVPMPDDPDVARAVEIAAAALDRAEAVGNAGDYKKAVTLAQAVYADAAELPYAPLLAESLFLLGSLQRKTGDGTEAEKTLTRAIAASAAARDDDLTALIWIEMLWVVGYTQAKVDDGIALRKIAEPAAIRSGNAARMGDLLNNLGALHRRKSDYRTARQLLERALATWTKVYGEDDLQVAKAHNNLGNVLTNLGELAKARKHHLRGIEIREKGLGDEHPLVARSYNNLGNSYLDQGRTKEARAAYERALAIYEANDPNSDEVAMALNNLGNAYADLGDFAKAQRSQERAIEIQIKTLPEGDPALGISYNNLGDVYLKSEEFEKARKNHMRARQIWQRKLGKDHSYIGYASAGLGLALLGLEKPVEARAEFERARSIWVAAHGADHPNIATALTGIGLAELAQNHYVEASTQLSEALRRREKHAGDPSDLATTQFALARALWGTGKNRKKAAALARKASAHFESLGARGEGERKRVEAWLADPNNGPP